MTSVLGTALKLGVGYHVVKNLTKDTKEYKNHKLKKLIKQLKKEVEIK